MTLQQYFDPTAITQQMKDIAMQFRNLMGGKDFILYQWINDGGATNVPKMAEAQAAGPYSLGIPVNDGWNQVHPTIATGKPAHVVSGYAVSNDAVNISDNYSPFLKVLDPGYQISYVLQVIVQYIPPPPAPVLPPNPTPVQTSTWITQLIAWLGKILGTVQKGSPKVGNDYVPMTKLPAYNFTALGQALLDILIKVVASAIVAFLNAIVAAATNGSIHLPAPAITVPALGLIVSQFDSYFVKWTGPQA
jgi:hypothetical protein